MNSGALLEKLDLRSAFSEAAAEAFKDGLGEITKDELAREGVSVLWTALASEATKTLIGTMAGPFLRVLLRVADQSQGKMDKMIREPFVSGTGKAERMLKMRVITPADLELRDNELMSSLDDLNKAYSFADSKKDEILRLRIRILQITIALFLNAPGYAQTTEGT